MVTISTTPVLPPTGSTGAPPTVDAGDGGVGDGGVGDGGVGDGGDWLVGDDDVAGPPAVPRLVVTPPTPAVSTHAMSTHAMPTHAAVGTVHRHHRRPSIERVVAWSSALVGAGGILLGLLLALVNVEKWPESGVCSAYKTAHHGHGAFGCGGTRGIATVLPPVVTGVLVVGVLAVVWIPHHTARRRLELIAGLAALLVATALVEALVYAALP
jgi:hypothetical protein